MFRIRQTNERDLFISPVLLKGCRRVGSHCKDLRTASGEFIIIITQARQLRAAMRSHKAAQEYQQNGPAVIIGQTDAVALHILQLKVRSQIPRGYQFTHLLSHLPQNVSEFI